MNAMPRNLVLVLVIDDQVGRKSAYESCLERVNCAFKGKWILDVHFCSDLGSAAALAREPGQPALAIVDMVLDSTDWTSTSVGLLDRRLLAERWPLLLVSGRFDERAALDRANLLLSGAAEKAMPSQFLLWSTIELASDSAVVAHQLTVIVDSLLSRDTGQDLLFVKEPEQPIDLLHITDAHFGKASWDAGALMMLRAKLDDYALEGADFLLLSGDIADQGTPSQYKAAGAYLNAIAHNGLVTARDARRLPIDRVLMCPGNHDFSRSIALGANITGTKKFSLKAQPVAESTWIRSLAWSAYYDFEAEMAGHSAPWIEDPGFRLNARFKNAGVIFLELNVEKYAIEGYQLGTTDIEIKSRFNAALARVSEIRKKGDCVIVVAHRHESDGWSSLAQMFDSFLGGLGSTGPVLLFCGHEHASRVSPECGDRALVVRGIPPVDGPSLPSKVLPVVHYVRLERAGGQVSGVLVHAFHQERSSWLDAGSQRRFVWNERVGWCKSA
jgi:hypothetical protein